MEFYEECAKKVTQLIHEYHNKSKEVADAMQKVLADAMYSETGKKILQEKLLAELAEVTKAADNDVKSVVKEFCNKYQVNYSDQGVDQVCVSNALKIIEMSGASLTADLLRNALEPLKKSHSTLKMIASLLHAKYDNALAIETYPTSAFDVMNEYLGLTNVGYEYETVFDEIKSILSVPELFHTGIHSESDYTGRVINSLITDDTYAVLALSDNMIKAGKLYDVVRMEYPEILQ